MGYRVIQRVVGMDEGQDTDISWLADGSAIDAVAAVAQILARPDDARFYVLKEIIVKRV